MLDKDAHIYCWVTNNFFPDGIKLVEALGFRYVTKITWTKGKITATEGKKFLYVPDMDEIEPIEFEKEKPGLGQYFRGLTEDCIFGVRGKLPYKIDPVTGKRCQGITGFIAPREEHSKKPDIMYDMIERVSYGPYIEMFARQERGGQWLSWGNEV